jgi:hypothetical protein
MFGCDVGSVCAIATFGMSEVGSVCVIERFGMNEVGSVCAMATFGMSIESSAIDILQLARSMGTNLSGCRCGLSRG